MFAALSHPHFDDVVPKGTVITEYVLESLDGPFSPLGQIVPYSAPLYLLSEDFAAERLQAQVLIYSDHFGAQRRIHLERIEESFGGYRCHRLC